MGLHQALNNLTAETAEGVAAFNEKRPVNYESVRRDMR
jgi:hypothetical protein